MTAPDRTVLVLLDTPAEGLRSPARELLTLARSLGTVTAVALAEPSEATLAGLADQGAASVQRNGMYADTRRYVANIHTHMTRFR